jgi:hypothetical protein
VTRDRRTHMMKFQRQNRETKIREVKTREILNRRVLKSLQITRRRHISKNLFFSVFF